MSMDSMKRITGHEIAALLNPRLAVLVTCCDRKGLPNVLTVAWHTPLSHQPPLVGISIGHTRFSHSLLKETKEFVINIVGVSMTKAIKICGSYTGALDDKLSIAQLRTGPASVVRSPLIISALGVLECQVDQQIETGDHTFFIGRVLYAEARRDFFSNAWAPQNEDQALLCLQRNRFGTFVEVKTNDYER